MLMMFIVGIYSIDYRDSTEFCSMDRNQKIADARPKVL